MEQANHVSVQLDRRLASISQSSAQLYSTLQQLMPHLAALNHIRESLQQFNTCFGNFLDAIDMQASTLSAPILSVKSDSIARRLSVPVPVSLVELGSSLRHNAERRLLPPAEIASDSVCIPPAAGSPTLTAIKSQPKIGTAHVKLNTAKLPPKYRSVAERRVLQRFLNALVDCYPDGLCLSELSSVWELSGIQAKEYAAVLMKQGQVERSKTHKGLTYRFKPAHGEYQ